MLFYLLDTRRKLNVQRTFRRCPGRLLNVFYKFISPPVSRGYKNIFTQCWYLIGEKLGMQKLYRWKVLIKFNVPSFQIIKKMVQENKKQSCLIWAMFHCMIISDVRLSMFCKTNFRHGRGFYMMLYQLSHRRLKDFSLFSITERRHFLSNYIPSMKLFFLKKMPSKIFQFTSFTKWLQFRLCLSVQIFRWWKPSCPKFLRNFVFSYELKFHRCDSRNFKER